MKVDLTTAKILFFDLEYYVQENRRNVKGLKYNPWSGICSFIGGGFLSYTPNQSMKIEDTAIKSKIDCFLAWNYENERKLVVDIFKYLMDIFDDVEYGKSKGVYPVLCGIGITHSDVPALIELAKKHNIFTPEEAFSFQSRFRTVDLSVYSIGLFRSNKNFVYPQRKNTILNKIFPDKKFESGTSVWDLYENAEYGVIEDRVKSEVTSTFCLLRDIRRLYMKHLDSYRELMNNKGAKFDKPA